MRGRCCCSTKKRRKWEERRSRSQSPYDRRAPTARRCTESRNSQRRRKKRKRGEIDHQIAQSQEWRGDLVARRQSRETRDPRPRPSRTGSPRIAKARSQHATERGTRRQRIVCVPDVPVAASPLPLCLLAQVLQISGSICEFPVDEARFLCLSIAMGRAI